MFHVLVFSLQPPAKVLSYKKELETSYTISQSLLSPSLLKDRKSQGKGKKMRVRVFDSSKKDKKYSLNIFKSKYI